MFEEVWRTLQFGPDPLLLMANKFRTSPKGVLETAWKESYITEPPEKILSEFLENYGFEGYSEENTPLWFKDFLRRHKNDTANGAS